MILARINEAVEAILHYKLIIDHSCDKLALRLNDPNPQDIVCFEDTPLYIVNVFDRVSESWVTYLCCRDGHEKECREELQRLGLDFVLKEKEREECSCIPWLDCEYDDELGDFVDCDCWCEEDE